jgi:hypothetical protein
MPERQPLLNINVLTCRLPQCLIGTPYSDPSAFIDVQHDVRRSPIAEQGTFDAVFLSDTSSFADRPGSRRG